MNDRLACIAWNLCRYQDGILKDERRIMLIEEYLIIGTRVMKGVDAVEYRITRHPTVYKARHEAVRVTEGFEARGLTLTILPTMQWSKKDAAATKAWLYAIGTGQRSGAALSDVFNRTIGQGIALDPSGSVTA